MTGAKYCVVSGAASGIGLAVSKALLGAGYQVIGIDRRSASGALEGNGYRHVELDISNLATCHETLNSLCKALDGPIVLLMNNAGIGKMGFLEQLSVQDLQDSLHVNFLAHAVITRCLLPILKKQTRANIIFTGSEAALRGAKQGAAYCASKFALRGFVQSLREECGKSPVAVSLINPGPVRTPFFEQLHFEPGEAENCAIDPQELARLVLHILSAPDSCNYDEVKLSPPVTIWQNK